MARKTFCSFEYEPDCHRVSQVRSIGAIEGNKLVSSNKWEEITDGGNPAIKVWINKEMSGKTAVIVFIGATTAGRKWINYEIKKAWSEKRGVLGIHIHNLKNLSGIQTHKGSNPFKHFTVGNESMDKIVPVYDPPFAKSTNVYAHIKDNIEDWIEEAIDIRNSYD